MRTSSALVTFTVLATLAGTGHRAFADKDKDKADSLFKQGKKLMGEKRYADACAAFEQSFKLDPGIGGELNVAKCYEDWGKLARAYHAYEQAEQMAKDAKDPRATKIHDLMVALDAQVPRLTIKVPAGANGDAAAVTIDGTAVAKGALGSAQLVDPGPHQIEYQGTSGKKTKIVPVERGGSSEISLDLPRSEADGHAVTPAVKPAGGKHAVVAGSPDPGRNMKIAGLAVGGAGVVAVGVSSYLALSARSKYKDALALHCGGMTNTCDDVGLQATHDARHEANIASIVFTTGLALVGGGVALYMLAPHRAAHTAEADPDAYYLVPTVNATGGGLVFGGSL